jgi:hypothetical protein
MPWTSNGCGTTAEFIELLNFGPGPVNIGCYILSTGIYSITIPPNTIVQPGEFYVIGGQDFIPSNCANIDSTSTGIHTKLNWNTCNCTNIPVPTTGDGLMVDGGSSNTPLVLFDPGLNFIDAVVRSLPTEITKTIFSSNVAGECITHKFNLGGMPITYEQLGMSAGRGNSFARKLDGDCGWLKDPQQSGNATNNTAGSVSDVTYTLSVVKSMDCDTTHGSIDIYVEVGAYTDAIFPMNYTIAFDANNDGIFDFSDTYTYGTDSTPPSIAVTGLPLGRYKVTVGSVNGCFLRTFDITILQCTDVLTVQLQYFKLLSSKAATNSFEWQINQMESIISVVLEKSLNGILFSQASRFDSLHYSGTRIFQQVISAAGGPYYRLRLTNNDGQIIYSSVISTLKNDFEVNRLWPNPAINELFLKLNASVSRNVPYYIYNGNGQTVAQGIFPLKKGTNILPLSVLGLRTGMYIVKFPGNNPVSFMFVKH